MAVTQVTAYECNTCGELHSYSRDAEECCPRAKRVTAWDCGCLGRDESTECPQYRCHRSADDAQRCAAERGAEVMCECGCKSKWHGTSGACLSPDCKCRRFTVAQKRG